VNSGNINRVAGLCLGQARAKLWHTLQALPQLHLATTALAVLSLLLVVMPRAFLT
jgi:hypothetical protein